MESILSSGDKKYLKFFTKYLKSYGEESGTFTVYDVHENSNFDFSGVKMDENYYLEIPEKMEPILEKIAIYSSENLPDFDIDSDDISASNLIITIYYEGQINSKYCVNYRTRDEGESQEISLSEDPERLKNIFNWMEGEEAKTVRVVFNGYGDSGEISGMEVDDEGWLSVESIFEDYCYNILERDYGGWEINEGSDGNFFFDLKKKKCYVNFSWNNEQTECSTVFEEKF